MVKNNRLKRFLYQNDTCSTMFCLKAKNTLKVLAQSRKIKAPLQQIAYAHGHLNVKHLNSNVYKCTKKRILTRFRGVMSDQTRRGRFEVKELQSIIFKSVFRSQPLDNAVFGHFGVLGFTALAKKSTKRSGSFTSIRNRCVLTGRAQTLKHLRLSRIQIRLQAGRGKIPGCIKV